MENRKNIDDLFKEELGNYTETPPQPVWDAIEKRLDSTPIPPSAFSNRKIWHWALLCGILILSIPVTRNLTGYFSTSRLAVSNAAPVTNTPVATTPPANDQVGDNSSQPGNTSTTAAATTTDNDNTEKAQPVTPKNKIAKVKAAQIKRRSTTTNSNIAHLVALSKSRKIKVVKDQPENISYGSDGNPAPLDEDATTKPEEETEKDKIADKEPAKNDKPVAQDDNKKTPNKPRPKFDRFEAGVKIGYETGFDNGAGKKAVISPYMQYKVTPKLAIMLQPAFKYARLSTRRIGHPQSYNRSNNDSAIAIEKDPYTVVIPGVDSLWLWHYKYSQSHDSIVKSNYIGGGYAEFELPVLLKYYISKNFSVYGGVNITYSKLLNIDERTRHWMNIMKDTSLIQLGPTNSPAPKPDYHVKDLINNNAPPFSDYTGPQYPAQNTDMFRLGYMIGFSVESKRWLFDALVQQASVKSNVQWGYNVNTALSAPYVRITLGYKLVK